MTTYTLIFDDFTLTNEDLIEAPKYNICLNSNDDFCLGNAASAEVSFKTKELTSSSIGEVFKLKRQEESGALADLGDFIIREATKDKNDVFTIKAYDFMTNFDIDVAPWLNELTFPITLKDFIDDLADYCGIDEVDYKSAPNQTLSIQKFTANSVSGRQLLKYASQATGRFLRVTGSGVLSFNNYSGDQSITLDSSLYTELNLNDFETPAITGLWIGKEDGDVGVTAGTDTNQYRIYNNPMLFNCTSTTAQNILNEIKNRAYYGGTVKLRKSTWRDANNQLKWINPGFMITVDGKTFLVMEMSNDNKGFTLKCKGKQEISHVQTVQESIDAVIGKTNVFKRTLDSTVSTITDIDGRLETAESTIEQHADEILLKVSKDEVISSINLSSEAATINANKINLTGYITATDLATSGQTTINGDNITTGSLSANRIQGGTLSGSTININDNFIVDEDGLISTNGGVIATNNIVSTGDTGNTDINGDTISTSNLQVRNYLTLGETYKLYPRTNGTSTTYYIKFTYAHNALGIDATATLYSDSSFTTMVNAPTDIAVRASVYYYDRAGGSSKYWGIRDITIRQGTPFMTVLCTISGIGLKQPDTVKSTSSTTHVIPISAEDCIATDGSFKPVLANTYSLGSANYYWQNTYTNALRLGNNSNYVSFDINGITAVTNTGTYTQKWNQPRIWAGTVTIDRSTTISKATHGINNIISVQMTEKGNSGVQNNPGANWDSSMTVTCYDNSSTGGIKTWNILIIGY